MGLEILLGGVEVKLLITTELNVSGPVQFQQGVLHYQISQALVQLIPPPFTFQLMIPSMNHATKNHKILVVILSCLLIQTCV